MTELPNVLQLDVAGNPNAWITYQDAATYYAKGLVAWSPAESDFTLHGGRSRLTGNQTTLDVMTIIAIKGKISSKQLAAQNRIPLTNRELFRRDQHICAYCGDEFSARDLTRDHVLPTSRGGKNVWENVVTSCGSCNKAKDNMTPEEFARTPLGGELLYVPYRPNRAEFLILNNRKILADQMAFLLQRVPKESRLL